MVILVILVASSSSIAPHLGLPSLPQCIALEDRWTGRKIKTHIKYRERKASKTSLTPLHRCIIEVTDVLKCYLVKQPIVDVLAQMVCVCVWHF